MDDLLNKDAEVYTPKETDHLVLKLYVADACFVKDSVAIECGIIHLPFLKLLMEALSKNS